MAEHDSNSHARTYRDSKPDPASEPITKRIRCKFADPGGLADLRIPHANGIRVTFAERGSDFDSYDVPTGYAYSEPSALREQNR